LFTIAERGRSTMAIDHQFLFPGIIDHVGAAHGQGDLASLAGLGGNEI
jgi:hypothetical protein